MRVSWLEPFRSAELRGRGNGRGGEGHIFREMVPLLRLPLPPSFSLATGDYFLRLPKPIDIGLRELIIACPLSPRVYERAF